MSLPRNLYLVSMHDADVSRVRFWLVSVDAASILRGAQCAASSVDDITQDGSAARAVHLGPCTRDTFEEIDGRDAPLLGACCEALALMTTQDADAFMATRAEEIEVDGDPMRIAAAIDEASAALKARA